MDCKDVGMLISGGLINICLWVLVVPIAIGMVVLVVPIAIGMV